MANNGGSTERAISKEGILWLTMVLATMFLGVSFSFAERLFNIEAAIIISAVGIGVTLALNFVFIKVKWVPIISIFSLSVFIGVAYSIFFIKVGISQTYFYLGIVGDLFIIAALLYFKIIIKEKKNCKIFLLAVIALEIIITVLLGYFTSKDPALFWGLFFGEINIIFMTCSVFVLLSENNDLKMIFRESAVCCILGYLFIFVIAASLIMSIIKKTSPMQCCGDILGKIAGGGR